MRRILMALAALASLGWAAAAHAQSPPVRKTIWNIAFGTAVADMPAWIEFKSYACGSNGGPPRQAIAGWSDFKRCRVEENGLYEVYFEYDDEYEYIARARDMIREIPRYAGTTEQGFSVITSLLFDAQGRVAGMRMASDPRPDFRVEVQQNEGRTRREAHSLSGSLAARFAIDAKTHCRTLPLGPGESPIGDFYIKQACERVDEAAGKRYALWTSYFRKAGQTGFQRDVPSQPTQGEFESLTRLEILALPVAAGR